MWGSILTLLGVYSSREFRCLLLDRCFGRSVGEDFEVLGLGVGEDGGSGCLGLSGGSSFDAYSSVGASAGAP